LALWSTRSEYLSSDGFQDTFHRQNQNQYYHRGYSALRVGIMVDAHPYAYLPSPSISTQYPHALAPPSALDRTVPDETSESLFGTGELDNFDNPLTTSLSESLAWTVHKGDSVAGKYTSTQMFIDRVIAFLREYRRGWRVGSAELRKEGAYVEVSHQLILDVQRGCSGYRKLTLRFAQHIGTERLMTCNVHGSSGGW